MHRARKERGRYISESVGVEPALQRREKLGGETASARADFQNAEPSAFGQHARGFLQRRGNGGEPVAGQEAVAIKLIEEIRTSPGKEDLDRILFAAKDWTEFSTISGNQERLGKMTGVFLDECPLRFGGRIGGLLERSHRAIAAFR